MFQSRFTDDLELFNSICNSQWFSSTPIILLLIGPESFAENLHLEPLSDRFPDSAGAIHYSDYLLSKFVTLDQSNPKRQVYNHLSSTRDTGRLEFVLGAMQDVLHSPVT